MDKRIVTPEGGIGTATVTKMTEYPTGGCRRVYSLSKEARPKVTEMLGRRPTRRHHVTCVWADYETTPDRGPETMVFACTESGAIIDYHPLLTVPGDAAHDDRAAAMLGLEVA